MGTFQAFAILEVLAEGKHEHMKRYSMITKCIISRLIYEHTIDGVFATDTLCSKSDHAEGR